MNYENIYIEEEDNIATITINRPKKLNALNKRTIAELHTAFKELDKDRETKVIIITGSGEKAFVAGADISEFAHFSVKEGKQLAAEGQKTLFDFVENLTTPVIAAINGFALGGGLELAMSSHFRIASDNAKMGLPEVFSRGNSWLWGYTASPATYRKGTCHGNDHDRWNDGCAQSVGVRIGQLCGVTGRIIATLS